MKFSGALTLSAMTSFVDKRMKNGLQEQLRWIESLAERFVVSSAEHSWGPVTSLVPWGGQCEVNTTLILGREGHAFNKFADDTVYCCIFWC